MQCYVLEEQEMHGTRLLKRKPLNLSTLGRGRSIDLSIKTILSVWITKFFGKYGEDQLPL